jgi:mannose-6-phosphate isomerase-like protein (cupin superfamily)
LPYPNGYYRIVLRGNQTKEQFTLIEGLIYVDEGARPHYHMSEDEMFVVVNGTLQFYVAGEQFCAQAGTTVYIPRNVTQSVRNINSKPVHVQILFSPAGREKFLEQISVINDRVPYDVNASMALLKQYGQVNMPAITWADMNCVVSPLSSSNASSRSYASSLVMLLFAVSLMLR